MSHHNHTPDTEHGPPVDERDLMAFADGRIAADSERAAALRAHLAAHPVDAARVAAWQRQNEAIRARYAPALAESVPPHLHPQALRERRARKQLGRRRFAVAASVAGLAVATALSVAVAPGGSDDADLDRFASEISQLSADALPAAAGGAVAVGAAVDSPSGRLPSLNLAGFALTERRTVRAGGHTATEARYEDQRGQTVRLFVAEQADAGRPELHRMQRGGREIVYWREDGRMYALSAESVDSQRLQQIATATMRNDLQRRQQPESAVAEAPRELREAPVVSADALKANSGGQRWNAPVESAPSGVVYDGMQDESL